MKIGYCKIVFLINACLFLLLPFATGGSDSSTNSKMDQQYDTAVELMKQGKLQKALRIFKKIASSHPDYLDLEILIEQVERQITVKNMLLEARHHLRAEEFKQAETTLMKIMRLDPLNTEGRDLLSSLIELKERASQQHYQIGMLHYQRNDFKQAENELKQVLSLDPDYKDKAEILETLSSIVLKQDFLRAETFLDTYNFDKAIESFKDLERRYPKNQEIKKALNETIPGLKLKVFRMIIARAKLFQERDEATVALDTYTWALNFCEGLECQKTQTLISQLQAQVRRPQNPLKRIKASAEARTTKGSLGQNEIVPWHVTWFNWTGGLELETKIHNFTFLNRENSLYKGEIAEQSDYDNQTEFEIKMKHFFSDSARLLVRPYVRRTQNSLDQDESTFYLRQFYLQMFPSDSLEFRIGKQRFSWGTGYAWNPTNAIEPQVDVIDPSIEKNGVIALRFDYIVNRYVTIIGAVVPNFPENELEEPLQLSTPKTRYGGRFKLFIKNTDLSVIVYGGGDDGTMFGLDFSKMLSSFMELHFEVAWREKSLRGIVNEDFEEHAPTNYQDLDTESSFTFKDQWQTQLLLGGSYVLNATNTTLIFEYLWNQDGYNQDQIQLFEDYLRFYLERYENWPQDDLEGQDAQKTMYLTGIGNAFNGDAGLRQNYLFLGLEQRDLVIDGLSVSVRTLANLDDQSMMLGGNVSYGILDNLVLTLGYSNFSGAPYSEYEMLGTQNFLRFGLRWSFL